MATTKSNLIHTLPDGSTIVYISLWRYLIFGLLFLFAFGVITSSAIRVYHESVGMAMGLFAGAIVMVVFAVWFARGVYKKVQLEIGRSAVRFLSGGLRGGVLFSENYETISFSNIVNISLNQNILGITEIKVQTATSTNSIILLLSRSEKEICYEALQKAVQRKKDSEF